jgi:hypothetical protein
MARIPSLLPRVTVTANSPKTHAKNLRCFLGLYPAESKFVYVFSLLSEKYLHPNTCFYFTYFIVFTFAYDQNKPR